MNQAARRPRRHARSPWAGLVTGMALLAVPAFAATKEEVAVVHTGRGDIAFRFLERAAPGHVAYVKELIRRGFYDGTTFHRVIPHFVIQGGDPNSKDSDRSNDGDGEADRRLKAEFSTALHYRPGTVGMARDADPDSGSCQFFIALENLPRLDGKYTIFGEVISGMEVARTIANQPRDLKDNPLESIVMKVELKTKKVPPEILSLKEGPNGEVLTGPGKPKPWDPSDVRWKAPALTGRGNDPVQTAAVPLDLCVDESGAVLDVRFGRLDTPEPAKLQDQIKRNWRFSPAQLDGSPVKARFSMDSGGTRLAPSQVPGTPVDFRSEGSTLPQVVVRATVPEGALTPEKEPALRLTIDESGHVTDVSLQATCGDRALDEAAMNAAKVLRFTPAHRGKDPVAVYLDISVKWTEESLP